MTIFTSNLNEKKEDEDFIPPEVVDYVSKLFDIKLWKIFENIIKSTAV